MLMDVGLRSKYKAKPNSTKKYKINYKTKKYEKDITAG
jgi:hypothetical protein